MQDTDLSEETFVYKGEEVYLTGRVAQRKGRRKTQTLYEVQKVALRNIEGGQGSTSWVSYSDLYVVVDNETEEISDE